MNSQQQAIKKDKGPCVILAGAGTGKTYTIVEKVKHLVNSGIYAPEKIVCLTFSNEAANSLAERILKSIHTDEIPVIKTFHSFCADLLKKHGGKIGIPENFRILLPDDAKLMLHKNFQTPPALCHKYIGEIGIAKDLGIFTEDLEEYLQKKRAPEPEELEQAIDLLNFQLQISGPKSQDEKSALKEQIQKVEKILKMRKFLQAWKAYEKLKNKKNLQDYSDLNKSALLLLEKHPEISNEYDYIIVDEFQDTNKLQCLLLEKIAPHKNITIVGDLNQSIYRFRGAYRDNFPNFKKTFNVKNEDIFALDKSFRSTNKILKAAHKLIENNYENKSECFEVKNAFGIEGQNPEVYELKNNKEETRKIIEIIKEDIKSGVPAGEICVMFRTHQQAKMLKSSLDFEGIPYISITKKSLLKTRQIRETMNYLTIINKLKRKEKGGEHSWWDLFFLSGFVEQDLVMLTKFIKTNKEEACLSIKILNGLSQIPLTEEGKVKAHIILNKIKSLLQHSNLPVHEIIMKIYESLGFYSIETPNLKEIIPVLEKFVSLAKEHSEADSPELHSFLHHLELIKNLGIEIEAPETNKAGVKIMTNHATKGLEYSTVIVSNLASKRFPLENMNNSLIPLEIHPEFKNIIQGSSEEEIEKIIKKYEQENSLAEERRLCYVAFTRAKKRLVMTYANYYGSRKAWPSRFLNEIDYKKNFEISFIRDNSEKYVEPKKNFEIKKTQEIQTAFAYLPGKEQNQESMTNEIVFSPSALQTFNQCQKRYEYKYIYNMPDPAPVAWDVIKLGSFAHLIFEHGVKAGYTTEKEFIDLAKTLQMSEDWNFIDIKEVIPLIRVFFYRNKNKYNSKSLTEQRLFANIGGLKFVGIADRIDFHDEGLEIVDYKTGASDVLPRYRNWQLGFYAFAAQKFGRPRRLTLDMLKKEKPVEFVIDDNGNAREVHSQRTFFNLEEVKQEMLAVAKEILNCHSSGFKACPPEKNCDFCSEFFWEN